MPHPGPRARFAAVLLLTGIGAGLGGVALTLLLRLVERLASGGATGPVGQVAADPVRRVVALGVTGLAVGLGWAAMRSRGLRPVAVDRSVAAPGRRTGVRVAAVDAALQVVAVGAGASLGREGAPRQLGAAVGGWLAERAGLDADGLRTALACGAGAGLAAVYDVPLAGAVFTVELLLRSAALRHAVPALLTSAVAAVVGWTVTGDRPVYAVSPGGSFSTSLLVFAVVVGPLAGIAGVGFARLTALGRSRAVRGGWRLPVATTLVFAALGAVAVPLPQVLGNGSGPAQLAFDASLGAGTLLALAVLKPVATAACLGSGATGGLLTPALATGALVGGLAGDLWSRVAPATPAAGPALVTAAAVLAVTQRAPLLAVVLVVELTAAGPAVLPALAVAAAGAVLTTRALPAPDGGRRAGNGTPAEH